MRLDVLLRILRERKVYLTFNSEGFPNSQQLTVSIDGHLIVQQGFVHDESIKLRGICPSQHKERGVIGAHAHAYTVVLKVSGTKNISQYILNTVHVQKLEITLHLFNHQSKQTLSYSSVLKRK